MAWDTVFSQVYTVNAETERLTLPINLPPYFRLIISTTLLAGLGSNERFLGTLSQQLAIPGIGEVRGRSLALTPGLQLLTPTTEFAYKLLYLPPKGPQFTFQLAIQVELTVSESAGNDNGPVLAAIANLHQLIGDLPEPTTAIDYSVALAGLIANQDELRGDVAGVMETLLGVNATLLAAITEQTQALQAAMTANHAATTTTLAAIYDRQTPATPTPTPTPAPQLPTFRAYTPTGINALSFFNTDSSLSALRDGNPDVNQSVEVQRGPHGMISFTVPVLLRLTFSSVVRLTRLRILTGQFNGSNLNRPSGFTLYKGDTTAQPLFSFSDGFTANDGVAFREFDLSSLTVTDSIYRIDFTGSGSISIYEMQFWGVNG